MEKLELYKDKNALIVVGIINNVLQFSCVSNVELKIS